MQPVETQRLDQPERLDGVRVGVRRSFKARCGPADVTAPSGTCPWNRSPVTFTRRAGTAFPDGYMPGTGNRRQAFSCPQRSLTITTVKLVFLPDFQSTWSHTDMWVLSFSLKWSTSFALLQL